MDLQTEKADFTRHTRRPPKTGLCLSEAFPCLFALRLLVCCVTGQKKRKEYGSAWRSSRYAAALADLWRRLWLGPARTACSPETSAASSSSPGHINGWDASFSERASAHLDGTESTPRAAPDARWILLAPHLPRLAQQLVWNRSLRFLRVSHSFAHAWLQSRVGVRHGRPGAFQERSGSQWWVADVDTFAFPRVHLHSAFFWVDSTRVRVWMERPVSQFHRWMQIECSQLKVPILTPWSSAGAWLPPVLFWGCAEKKILLVGNKLKRQHSKSG